MHNHCSRARITFNGWLPVGQPESEWGTTGRLGLDFWSRADLSARRLRGASIEEVEEFPGLGVGLDRTPWAKPDDVPRSLEIIDGTGAAWIGNIAAGGRRLFDITFSLLALIASAPIMIAIVVAIRFSSPGPAIYRHRRVGKGGRAFNCLKFRTMVMKADEVLDALLANDEALRAEFEEKHKLTNDPRITRIGRLLRKTSLDELPQFWNILKGDMSVVGPRPLVSGETERYGPHLPLILSVRPGLTGLWQVSGRNDTTYEERVDLDRQYVLSRNLARDLLIIAKTVVVMLKPSNGAY